MDQQDQPSAQTIQPASTVPPQYETPESFPTPAHPIPRLPRWLAVVLFLFILAGVGFSAYSFFAEQQAETAIPPTARPSQIPTNEPSPIPSTPTTVNETFCGGIAAIQCPAGYSCKLEGTHPDAGGTCVPLRPTTQVTPTAQNIPIVVQKARADLAKQRGVQSTQIEIVSLTEQEWSNAALGCPQPDMMYTEVITPGYQILFKHNNTIYQYHTDMSDRVLLCERPQLR